VSHGTTDLVRDILKPLNSTAKLLVWGTTPLMAVYPAIFRLLLIILQIYNSSLLFERMDIAPDWTNLANCHKRSCLKHFTHPGSTVFFVSPILKTDRHESQLIAVF